MFLEYNSLLCTYYSFKYTLNFGVQSTAYFFTRISKWRWNMIIIRWIYRQVDNIMNYEYQVYFLTRIYLIICQINWTEILVPGLLKSKTNLKKLKTRSFQKINPSSKRITPENPIGIQGDQRFPGRRPNKYEDPVPIL